MRKKNKKILILTYLTLVCHMNAWAQEILTHDDYKFVYTLRDVVQQIGGYDYSEFTWSQVNPLDSASIYVTDVKGKAVHTTLYLIAGLDTLCVTPDTTGKIKISIVELKKYNRYFIPADFAKYEEMSGPLKVELHAPLDWRVLMHISSLHIVMKTFDVPTDYYLHSKIPLTEKDIDELRKDIMYNTHVSQMYDCVYIHGAVNL